MGTNEKLAVLVFLHGGAFMEGESNDIYYGPDLLLEQNVILVTLNYRLGIFGFLSLGTPEYSGNMGLKDQQLALKWVHLNIDHFSGDNQRITLFGQSAGAASVHLQMLSSESRKYFRRAVPLSGTAFNYWAISEQNDHSALAHTIAKELGEPKQSIEQLVDFFKEVPSKNIVNYGSLFIDEARRAGHGAFIPVIESEIFSVFFF